jgi:ABC-2 type transport system permease protein
MSSAPEIPLIGSDSRPGLADFVRQTAAVAEAEVRKLRHDPLELATRAVQPALWLLVFGGVFSRVRGLPTDGVPYRDFMTPGVLAQSTLFIAIFYGISVIWERDLGVMQKYLVSPAPRAALVLGKALSAGARGLSQAVIVYALALMVGIQLRFEPGALAGVLVTVVLGSAVFSIVSLIAACLVKTRERLMGIGQILTMPLFFASNAVYPLSLMPAWLRAVSILNPLTYQVDALRALMIQGTVSTFGLGVDYGVQIVSLAALVLVASRLYPRLVT